MTFLDSGGSPFNITLQNPKDNITAQDIISVMDLILQKNIFQGKNGDLMSKYDARIIETNSEDLYNP